MWRGQASAKARWHLAQVGCNDASALMPLLSRDARLARCATDGGVGLLPLLLIDIGSNLGGFLEEAAHALGDLDSRLEQNSKANVCRCRFASLPAPLDVIAVEGNSPTCEALRRRLGAELHRTGPQQQRTGATPAVNVSVWMQVRDADGKLHGASGRTTLICAAAGESHLRGGVALWMLPATGDSTGQEFGVGLATATTSSPTSTSAQATPATSPVDVSVLSVDSLYMQAVSAPVVCNPPRHDRSTPFKRPLKRAKPFKCHAPAVVKRPF
mmetsp:Transcript_48773/g.114169  ORF Transcript_48773/g.114169 Transcript_48773/m.114169 type:complete len:270 (+) Transcript_48773:388-1197(+)